MPLMPKRVKFRKSQRGRVRGNARRGNTVKFGDYGLQSVEGGWLSAEAIEAGRITAAHTVRGEGRLYIRVFPHKSNRRPARVGGPRVPGARGLQNAVPVSLRDAAAQRLEERRL